MSATDKLARLEEIIKLSMQRPWEYCVGSKSHGGLCMCGMIYSIPADVAVAVALCHLDENYTLGEGPTPEAKSANSKLICALVNNAPTLIEVIRRLRETVEIYSRPDFIQFLLDTGKYPNAELPTDKAKKCITTTDELLEGMEGV